MVIYQFDRYIKRGRGRYTSVSCCCLFDNYINQPTEQKKT